MRVIAVLILAVIAGAAQAKDKPAPPPPQSKTERCMGMDYKEAMACLQGLVTEQNREKMRRAIASY